MDSGVRDVRRRVLMGACLSWLPQAHCVGPTLIVSFSKRLS